VRARGSVDDRRGGTVPPNGEPPARERAAAIEGLRLLITVTLNENQLRSHLGPIVALEEVEAVTLVADVMPPPLRKLTAVVPPPLLVKLLGRAGAKLGVCLWLALRERPDWVMGYNLVPHGLNALIVGKVTRRKSLFHMIGGPIEIEGGGWESDNAVLGRLPRPLPWLERLLVRLVRACTVVATMGEDARGLLVGGGMSPDRVIAIPASVDENRFFPRPDSQRDYDLVTVSQLIPRKRVEDFLQVVALLRRDRPGLRAAIGGGGPLEDDLRRLAIRLGIEDAVDFLGFQAHIEDVYVRSRVFVLTSRYEGLSIAISEAMASGLPVVVTDVGEVRDLVHEGENGYLLPVGDIGSMASRVGQLLDDPARRESLAAAAAADARALSGRARVTRVYRELFERIR
jgi:glycosyltransferase involved in cell wall biosynthesis